MTLPNFLILGAPKCGTSSLWAYLNQHPEIFMCVPKEPTFFGHEGEDGLSHGPDDENRAYHSRVITNIKDYTALFDRVTNQKAIGEASVYSLYLPKAPIEIKKYVPQAKMFAILRNPADRAYSSYLHVVRQARERYPFARALQEEPERIRKNWNPVWYFKTMGFYYEQVKRYFDLFGRNQVHVYLYEDFQKEQLRFIKRILEILGVDSSFVPDTSKRAKTSYVPKNPAWERFLHKTRIRVQFSEKHFPKRIRWRVHKVAEFIDRVGRSNRMLPPPVPDDVRVSLLEDYREDILKLQDLLGRDLSHWLVSASEPVGAST